jgi:hypothetical protein
MMAVRMNTYACTRAYAAVWRGAAQRLRFWSHLPRIPPAETAMQTTREKPPLTFWQIWNMCFGFLGIQFGFALQNANVSRIFQTLGADMGHPGAVDRRAADRADRAADRGLPV